MITFKLSAPSERCHFLSLLLLPRILRLYLKYSKAQRNHQALIRFPTLRRTKIYSQCFFSPEIPFEDSHLDACTPTMDLEHHTLNCCDHPRILNPGPGSHFSFRCTTSGPASQAFAPCYLEFDACLCKKEGNMYEITWSVLRKTRADL